MKRPLAHPLAVGSIGVVAFVASYTLVARPQPLESNLPSTQPASIVQNDAPPATLPASLPVPAEYRILLERSMFSKKPGIASATSLTDPTHAPALAYTLRGVASQEGDYVAFVENTTNNGVLRLSDGDAVGPGIVHNLTLGGVDYEAAGQITHVAIGSRFDGSREGEQPDAPAPTLASGETPELKGADRAPTTAPTTTTASAVDQPVEGLNKP